MIYFDTQLSSVTHALCLLEWNRNQTETETDTETDTDTSGVIESETKIVTGGQSDPYRPCKTDIDSVTETCLNYVALCETNDNDNDDDDVNSTAPGIEMTMPCC